MFICSKTIEITVNKIMLFFAVVMQSNEFRFLNKKDGYRQQNVRQRQKLISIIDYDVCMTFY